MNDKVMCSKCNTNPATVHYTDVVNGVPQSHRFCLGCAKQAGLFNISLPMDDIFKSFDKVMKSFDDAFNVLDPKPQAADITCDNCGMTLSQFKKLGRFGCAKDYELFKVGPYLEKIQGASVHTGKTPEKSPEDKIKSLKKDMETAIKSENYEKAASLRDAIKKLELK